MAERPELEAALSRAGVSGLQHAGPMIRVYDEANETVRMLAKQVRELDVLLVLRERSAAVKDRNATHPTCETCKHWPNPAPLRIAGCALVVTDGYTSAELFHCKLHEPKEATE